jgi:hypothetical protein
MIQLNLSIKMFQTTESIKIVKVFDGNLAIRIDIYLRITLSPVVETEL